jgi:hypothetical protein
MSSKFNLLETSFTASHPHSTRPSSRARVSWSRSAEAGRGGDRDRQPYRHGSARAGDGRGSGQTVGRRSRRHSEAARGRDARAVFRAAFSQHPRRFHRSMARPFEQLFSSHVLTGPVVGVGNAIGVEHQKIGWLQAHDRLQVKFPRENGFSSETFVALRFRMSVSRWRSGMGIVAADSSLLAVSSLADALGCLNRSWRGHS